MGDDLAALQQIVRVWNSLVGDAPRLILRHNFEYVLRIVPHLSTVKLEDGDSRESIPASMSGLVYLYILHQFIDLYRVRGKFGLPRL